MITVQRPAPGHSCVDVSLGPGAVREVETAPADTRGLLIGQELTRGLLIGQGWGHTWAHTREIDKLYSRLVRKVFNVNMKYCSIFK